MQFLCFAPARRYSGGYRDGRARRCRIANIFAGLTITVRMPDRKPRKSKAPTTPVSSRRPTTLTAGNSIVTGFRERLRREVGAPASTPRCIRGRGTGAGPRKCVETGTTRPTTPTERRAAGIKSNAAGGFPRRRFSLRGRPQRTRALRSFTRAGEARRRARIKPVLRLVFGNSGRRNRPLDGSCDLPHGGTGGGYL